MVVVDLIVALGVPLWLGVEEVLNARSEAPPVRDDVTDVEERTPAVESPTLRTA